MERRDDYIYFLRLFAGYEYTPSPHAVPFEYQSAEAPELRRLRQELHVDEISGDGSQWDRLLRLNHWVHTTLRYDGSSMNPEPRETLHILTVCRTEERGVNCRMLATVLNELCLSLGWKSRFVSCMPVGEDFMDNHVVTTVYIEEWKKWVFVDPTWDAYVEDSHGQVLSLEELRAAYITGQLLRVSDGINLNGEPGSGEAYLAYMAKNVFRFAVNLRSEYGAESKPEITQYWLHPLAYRPTNEVRVKKVGKHLLRRVYVSDPVFFWDNGLVPVVTAKAVTGVRWDVAGIAFCAFSRFRGCTAVSLEIRPARIEYAEALSRLMGQLTGHEVSPQTMEERIAFALNSSVDSLYVCHNAHEVLGVLGFRIRENLEESSRYGEISVIVVDKKARRRGIGRFLMDFAERLAMEEGCIGTWLVSGFGRKEEAHRFYQDLGYQITGYRFVKKFGGND
ncbi:Transglutaminase-like superfamily protein [Alicyclobacillus macrosporangiidus]|uniref:Transglutaminase-like superfamily protein n=1 Tax=Alicyclobacillus macrosporangiidus TaxID=392015 RepID=A0A1I7KNS2_9BACL|nr:Transglutaminase-like superfamily protein [Alicyclobacillus macrosporangiidus]